MSNVYTNAFTEGQAVGTSVFRSDAHVYTMSCKFEKFQLVFCFQNQMLGKKLSFVALGHLRDGRSIRYV